MTEETLVMVVPKGLNIKCRQARAVPSEFFKFSSVAEEIKGSIIVRALPSANGLDVPKGHIIIVLIDTGLI